MMPRFLLLSLILISAVAPLSAFSAEGAGDDGVRAQVEQRARDFLEALKIRDLQTAYHLDAGSVNGTLTADTFFRRIMSAPADLLGYEITGVSLQDAAATVTFDATYKYPQLHDPYTTPRKLNLVLIDGVWYIADAVRRPTPMRRSGS